MAHTYKTTHSRHNAYHGFRFGAASLSIAAMCYFFSIHWAFGVISILPIMLITGHINSLVDARATYLYLNRDCEVSVTYAEARKYDDYFSPNDTGFWLPLEHLRYFPVEQRRPMMFAAMAEFDKRHNKVRDLPPPPAANEASSSAQLLGEQELTKRLEALFKDMEETKRQCEALAAAKTPPKSPQQSLNIPKDAKEPLI